MSDDLSDLEIAVLCDLLDGPNANLKAHKRSVLDQLVAKGLVEPAKDDARGIGSLLVTVAAITRSHDPGPSPSSLVSSNHSLCCRETEFSGAETKRSKGSGTPWQRQRLAK
jgi:hypothetical protein